jgi:rhamnosyltransferase
VADVLIVLRCFNDVRVVGETLDAVFAQEGPSFRVVAIDSGSSDGSVDVLRRFPLELVEIPLGSYIPGKVLNLGMNRGDEPLAAFVNSDCTPQNREWLARLVAPFQGDPKVAAVYGRQVTRPGAHPLVVKDYERAFGDGRIAATWRHFFSMAASAIRRSVWEARPFDEAIRYSEDVLWSWQRRQEGWKIAYAADSIAMHSHDYTVPEMRKRFAGEGKADAAIYGADLVDTSLLRGFLLPCAAEIARDVVWAARRGEFGAMAQAPVHRFVQKSSYRRGLIEGLSRG